MANKHGEQRHIRLAHFLINGCTRLARALVGKDVEFSKPREHEPVDKPWSLDSFLHKNMKILCKTCNPKQQDILFPGHQDKSDIEQWDISLLCLVITNCTNNETVRGDIKQLKKIRNIIFHAGNTDISQEVYDRNVEILDCIVERCCKFIDEPNFSLTMKELQENFKRGNVIVTDKDFETICQWYESDPFVKLHSRLDNFSDGQQLLMDKMDEILALMKQSGQKGIVLPGCMIPVERFKGVDEAACDDGHLMTRDKALSYSENKEQKLQDLFTLRENLLKWMIKHTDESVIMTIEDFAELCSCIGRAYIALGIALGLSFTCIERIQDQERDGKTRIKSMLEKWRRKTTEPTVGAMRRAIMNVLGIQYKDGKFLKGSFDRKMVVAWFDSKLTLGNQMTTSSDDQPCPDAQLNADEEPLSEQDLLKVTHFVSGKYKELAKCLFKKDIYPRIEQFEETYSLDDMRVLAVLLYWKKTDQDASIVHLREALRKLYDVQEKLGNIIPYDSTKINDQELQSKGRFEYIRGRADSEEKRPEETIYKRLGGASAERGLSGEGRFSEAEFKK